MVNSGLKKLIFGKKNSKVAIIMYLFTHTLRLKDTTASKMMQHTKMTLSTIIKALHELKNKDILNKTKGAIDGRSITWKLTAKGKMLALSLLGLQNMIREIENE